MNETNVVTQTDWLQMTFLGNQVWQYLFLLCYCVVAVFAARGVDWLATNFFMRLAKKTKTEWDDRLLQVMHVPLRLVVFLAFMHLGVQGMNAPDWLQTYIARGFGVVIAVAVTYVLLRVLDVTFDVLRDRYQKRDKRLDVAILILFRKSAKVFVVVTAVLVTADNIGIKVTGILASLGVTGLAVALASQETLSNLLGSIIILADRMFVIGDRIRIGTDEGTVEYIGVRSTRIRTVEGDVIAIPNRNFTTMSVRNFSKTNEQLVASKPTT